MENLLIRGRNLEIQPEYVVSAILFLVLTYAIYQRYFSPLAAIPGPFLASTTSLWLAFAYWKGDFHRQCIELHRQYGPLVRVAPDGVSVSDVNSIKTIYGSGSKFWKGKWYRHLKRDEFNLIGMTDEPQHKKHRHMVEPIYTLKSVRESEELMEEPMAAFVAQMKQQAGKPFDIVERMNIFAVDTLSSLFFGQSYQLFEKGEFKQMLSFTEANWRNYFWMAMLPPLGKFAKLIQHTTIIANVILSGGKAPLPILSWTAEELNKNLKAEKPRRDTPAILDKFIQLHRSDPQEFPEAAVSCAIFESIFAGFETCGATIPKIIWHIANTKGCQARLQQELDTVKNHGKVPGLLTYDELRQLPFLSACVSEGTRKEPITGINLSRSVPTGGVHMNGYFLPSGTEIGINPWVISYNEEIMTDPNEFKPDRWLNATKEQKTKMDRMDLFFSAGPASCPGRVIGQALMYKAVAVVFSNFDVVAVDPNQYIKEVNIFPVKWRDVQMRLVPRS